MQEEELLDLINLNKFKLTCIMTTQTLPKYLPASVESLSKLSSKEMSQYPIDELQKRLRETKDLANRLGFMYYFNKSYGEIDWEVKKFNDCIKIGTVQRSAWNSAYDFYLSKDDKTRTLWENQNREFYSQVRMFQDVCDNLEDAIKLCEE